MFTLSRSSPATRISSSYLMPHRSFAEGHQNKARNLGWKSRRKLSASVQRMRRAEREGTRLAPAYIRAKEFFGREGVQVNPFGVPPLQSYVPEKIPRMKLMFAPSSAIFPEDTLTNPPPYRASTPRGPPRGPPEKLSDLKFGDENALKSSAETTDDIDLDVGTDDFPAPQVAPKTVSGRPARAPYRPRK